MVIKSQGKDLASRLKVFDNDPAAVLDESLERARRLVSDRTGIISSVEHLELKPDEPPIFWAQSHPANAVPLGGKVALNLGSAASTDPRRATIKAVGESIERYCSSQYDKDFLLLKSFNKLDQRAVRPEQFALFSQSQYSKPGFPYAPMTSDTPLRWVRGLSLVHQEETYVPAGMTFVPYEYGGMDEPAIDNAISTGMACGPDRAAATYKAILEVIERDVFMIVWLNRLPRPRIDLSSVEHPFPKGLLKQLEGLPISCRAWLLTLDIEIAVILVQLSNASGKTPYSVVGIGIDLDPNRALGLALEEACMGYLGMNRYSVAKDQFQPEAGFRNVTSPLEHGIAHALWPELKDSMKFLTASEKPISIQSLPNSSSSNMGANVETLVRRIGDKGMDVIAVDLTLSDVDDVGFKVVRAIVPGMQPLDLNHNLQHLGRGRLYHVPYEMGLMNKKPEEEEFNPLPHPFP